MNHEQSDKKPHILGVGISGLVGSRIAQLLSLQYDFTNLSSETGIDITKTETLHGISDKDDYKVLLLLAAKADVDRCEQDKSLGQQGPAWQINVQGVQNIIDACKVHNKKIVYISTDFVFDGENTPQGGYSEEDTPHPLNWYAETKYQAEQKVQESGLPYIIMRIAYPYRTAFDSKKDFVRSIKDRLQAHQPIQAVTDHMMTPTFIDDIAYAFDSLLKNNATGIYHVVGSSFISPYDASITIAQHYGLDQSLISKTTRSEFFQNRAPRPFNLSIKNDKIQRLGVQMKSFEEGLEEMKRQSNFK